MVQVEPERCTLVNMSSGARMRCQFNPVVMRMEGGAARYTRQAAIGATSQDLQYDGRENRQYLLDFYMDAIGTGFDIRAFNAFVEALLVPNSGHSTAPPKALLVWPGLVEVGVVLLEAVTTFEQFAQDGRPLVCTTHVKLEAMDGAGGKR